MARQEQGKTDADITDVTYVTTVTAFSDHIYKIMKTENGNKKIIVCLKKAVTVVTAVTKVTVESPGAAYDNCNNYYNYFFYPYISFYENRKRENKIMVYMKIVVIVVIVVISDVKFQFVGENNITVARLTTAAIVQRRGYAAVCRRIPRLCAT